MVRYGEIYLKGQNRPYFLNLLVRRVRASLRGLAAQVQLQDSRILVRTEQAEEAMARIRRVFGVHSLCLAVEMPKDDFEAIARQAVDMMRPLSGTFKVQARRSDKLFFLDSPQINARLGEAVLNELSGQLRVDVTHPQHVLAVEIRDQAYLYAEVLEAAGGMPVGSNGKAALLLSGGIDSPVAGYMIAKRGVELCAVHFYSFPYTGERSKQKVVELARRLAVYACGLHLHIVPFTDIQCQIHEKCPPEYTTLIMRRYMMRLAAAIAQKEEAQALITGESIGQVASQTMDALCCTDAVADRPVFRPLIGFDKIEITALAKKIDTYETSCLPFEDCCTVFTPRHPVTHPSLEKALEAEQALDTKALVAQALEQTEVIELPYLPQNA